MNIQRRGKPIETKTLGIELSSNSWKAIARDSVDNTLESYFIGVSRDMVDKLQSIRFRSIDVKSELTQSHQTKITDIMKRNIEKSVSVYGEPIHKSIVIELDKIVVDVNIDLEAIASHQKGKFDLNIIIEINKISIY